MSEDVHAQIDALKRQIALLTRVIERIAPTEFEEIRRTLRRAERDAEPDREERDDDDRGPALATSAYRGATPGLPGLHCSSCGKPIAEDDPELRSAHGRVCVVCFQRG